MKVITANNWHTYNCISSEQTEACMLFCRWRVGFDPALELLQGEGGKGGGEEKRTHMVCHVRGKEFVTLIKKTTINITHALNFVVIRTSIQLEDLKRSVPYPSGYGKRAHVINAEGQVVNHVHRPRHPTSPLWRLP